MMPNSPVVAIGLLTKHDLVVLGTGFDHHFLVPNDDIFAGLLASLDQIDVEPFGKSVVLSPSSSARPKA